jgi:peptide/nickel transport system substrate-binding protein
MKSLRSAAAGVVALVLAAACATASTPAAAATSDPSATTLKLTVPADDGSLTPYTFDSAYAYVTLVYDTLTWRDADGTPKPWLAHSVEPSADGRTVTLRLADGVKWQDGEPLTSSDVAFTFRYMQDHPHPRFTPELDGVVRVDTPDPSTAVVALSHPSAGFMDQPLADVPILPAHLWRGLPDGKVAPDGLPVGSGPYKLTDHETGKSYTFKANGDYFRGAPAVGEIDVSIIPTADAAFAALARRSVDMVPYKPSLSDLDKRADLALRLARGRSYVGTSLTFNVRRPPFDRVDARRAVVGAIDRDRMALEIGDALPADRGLVHPESPWALPAPASGAVDLAAATNALAAQRLPNIEIIAPDNDPVKRDAARQVALALQRAGQQAVARPLPAADFANAVGGDAPTFMAAVETIPPLASYDPDYLRQLFPPAGSPSDLDHSGYSNPGLDQLLDRVATMLDPAGRKAAVDDTLRLIDNDAPLVSLVFVNGTYAYRPAVYNGWVYVKGTGILDKRSFVEPSQVRAADQAVAPDQKSGSGGGFPWTLVLLALIVAAVAGVVAALVRSRE